MDNVPMLTILGVLPLIGALLAFVVRGKADRHREGHAGMLGVSGRTGEGLAELIRKVTDILGARVAPAGIATRARHRQAMELAISAMESAMDELRAGPGRTELAAEGLRRAIRALDALVGRVDVEHLLDDIFASFCIGK